MNLLQTFSDVLERNSATLIKIGNISKGIIFIGMGAWSLVDNSLPNKMGTSDSVWFYILEIPFMIAATIAMFGWPISNAASKGTVTVHSYSRGSRLRMGALLADLLVAMTLAIVSSFYFVDYVAQAASVGDMCELFNLLESGKGDNTSTVGSYNAQDVEFVTSQTCETEQRHQVARIVRTVVYMVFQLLCVHPVVTFIIQHVHPPDHEVTTALPPKS